MNSNVATQPQQDLNTLFRRGLGLFQLKVFGSPELVRGGDSPVHFRTKKHLAVLLYLHFEGRTRSIPRDRLVDLLWPEVSPEKGRHSLSQALLAIRSRLGTDAVTGREHDVRLLAELPSDLSALRQGQVASVRASEPSSRLRRLRSQSDNSTASWAERWSWGNSKRRGIALPRPVIRRLWSAAHRGSGRASSCAGSPRHSRRAGGPCSWCRVRKSARAFLTRRSR